MKSLLSLFLLLGTAAFAQDMAVVTSQKDTVLPGGIHKQTISGKYTGMVYYDEANNIISKEAFEGKINYENNIDAYWDADTAIVAKLYTRRHNARISAENSKQLRDYLANLSGKPADPSKITVINFYAGFDNPAPHPTGKSDWDVYRKSYTNRLDAIGNVNQYWVYKHNTYLNYHYADKINWLHDKDGLIEASFLPAHFTLGSYIIIMPDGRCFIYYGQYHAKEVTDNLKKLIAAK